MQVFADEESGNVTGYCFSCKTFVKNPYGEERKLEDVDLPKSKSPEEIEAELEEIRTYKTVSLPSRRLRSDTLNKFGIKTALSEEDGTTPTAILYPITKGGVVTGYYVKTLGDKVYEWSVGDVKSGEPFGWKEAKNSGAYGLIIVEGRDDAAAMDQILNKHMIKEVNDKVVALPNGVNSTKSFSPLLKDLEKFKSIKICMDQDEAGKRAEEDLLLMIPNAKVVSLPCKDPNDCILEGKSEEAFKQVVFNASTPKNTRVVSAIDIFEEAREPTRRGEYHWPWPKMDNLMRGIRLGETIYVGAGVKMGKSELADELAKNFLLQGAPVFMAKPEEANKKTLKLIAGKIAGKNFVDPDIEFDYKAFDSTKGYMDKVFLVNLYQHLGWDTLKQDIIYAAKYHGVKAVFIDPITNLTNGEDSSDANAKLSGITQDLSAMAMDLNIVVFIFCHLKAPEGNLGKDSRLKKYSMGQYVGLGNCPHEAGGDVLSNQFAGSRAMMRSCNLMLGLEGNKDPDIEDEVVSNSRYLKILEDREFGNSEKVRLYRNPTTTLYKEI